MIHEENPMLLILALLIALATLLTLGACESPSATMDEGPAKDYVAEIEANLRQQQRIHEECRGRPLDRIKCELDIRAGRAK